MLDRTNSSLVSPTAGAALARAVHQLLVGSSVRLYVVGGSASAGAGGAGINRTFDARLTTKLNQLLEQAERSLQKPLGRVLRSNVAQGGTTSFWAALMGDALHGRAPHIVVWEYSINDHAVALEAAGRSARGIASVQGSSDFVAETMRYMLSFWLRHSLSIASPPPLLLLAYLWDKQPAVAFKPGNRALCRRMPVPGSAYAAQLPVVQQYSSMGASLAAVNVAGYVGMPGPGQRPGHEFCPLVADSYFHPSDRGHELVSDLLLLTLSRLLADAAAIPPTARARRSSSEAIRAAAPTLSLPRVDSAAADGVSARLDAILAMPSVLPSVALAWAPSEAPPTSGRGMAFHRDRYLRPPYFASGVPPPIRLFAKSVKERIDRKWMWLVPPCEQSNLTVMVPTADTLSRPRVASAEGFARSAAHAMAASGSTAVDRDDGTGRRKVRALSYFAMESPGARIRHMIDGDLVVFRSVKGSFLAQSWGYLQKWHMLEDWRHRREDPLLSSELREREWWMCAEPVPNARCIGYRCGLEFKMPSACYRVFP